MAAENPGKLRVGVILGGVSSEKEVSLESGRNIFSKIDRKKFNPVAVFMDSGCGLWEIPVKLLMRNSTRDIEEDLEGNASRILYEELKSRIDITVHRTAREIRGGRVPPGPVRTAWLAVHRLRRAGSAVGMDKYVGRRILAASGIDVPKTVAVDSGSWQADRDAVVGRIEREIGFPCIVKPTREGCSTAVKKVVSAAGIPAALEEALRWDNVALAEEMLTGMEVTCGVLGNSSPMALTPSETIPTSEILSLEDKFLYGQGENKTPARAPAEVIERIRQTAVAAFRALDLKVYSRIDMFVRENGSVAVLEPNSLPGMTPSTVLFHQAAESGISQTELISRIIEFSLEAHRTKKGPL